MLKKCIEIGQMVDIKRDLVSGGILRGIVSEIIDDGAVNEKGIEVTLDNGFIGNVVNLPEINWPDETRLGQMITRHEDVSFEMKSSFVFDMKLKCSSDVLLLKLVHEIVALLNSTTVGYVCLGVDNGSNILGLMNDFELIKQSLINHKHISPDKITHTMLIDRLELTIRSKLKPKILGSPTNPFDIHFYDLDGHTVCLIRTKNLHKIPHYVQDSSNGVVKTEFVVKDGTSTKILNTPDTISYLLQHNYQLPRN